MPTKLSSIQKAEMLTDLLCNDLEALETVKPVTEKEPPLSMGNGSKSITSDEIVANGETLVNEKFNEAAKNADSWDEPIPLEPTVMAQAFPIHCLPETLRNFALSVAEHNQTSIDMPAVSSLGVASTCLQGKCYGYMGTDENIEKAKYILARLEKKKLREICALMIYGAFAEASSTKSKRWMILSPAYKYLRTNLALIPYLSTHTIEIRFSLMCVSVEGRKSHEHFICEE